MSLVSAVSAALLATLALSGCGREAERRAEGRDAAQTAAHGREPEETSIPAFLDDATTTARVKTALLAGKGVNGFDINVATSENVVTLTGTVPDAAERERRACHPCPRRRAGRE